jgi:fumarate reductase subunit D
MSKSPEPILWSLFGAGGALSAMFIPVLLFLVGLAFPLGWISMPSYEHLHALSDNILTRLLLTVVISLSLFHWAHRFRFTLYDGLQLKHLNALIAVLCYGTALLVTGIAGYTLLLP